MRIFAALALLSACSPVISQVKANEYYPLKPGTTWVYKGTFLGQEETRTVVMGGEDADGFFHDDAGAKLSYDGEGLRDETRYLLREPIDRGQKWQSVAALGATERYEIKDAHFPCAAPAGKFDDCVEVHSSLAAAADKTLVAKMVYAKNVGLVRLETTLVQGEKRTPQVRMELVQFRP